MRIVFFTDPHLSVKKPSCRKDDYHNTIKTKLDEIIQESMLSDYVISAGDIFDRYNPVIRTMNVFMNFIDKLHCPLVLCAGNHDLQGNNYEQIESTGIGHVCRFFSDKKVVLLNIDRKKHSLSQNVDIWFKETDPVKSMEFFNIEKEKPINIGIIHDMVINNEFFDNFTLLEDFETNLDLLFNGHYHPGHEHRYINKTHFVNTGAMSRMSLGKSDTTRKPKYAIITVGEEDRSIEVDYKSFSSYEKDVFHQVVKSSYQEFFDSIEEKEIDNDVISFMFDESNKLSESARNVLREIYD